MNYVLKKYGCMLRDAWKALRSHKFSSFHFQFSILLLLLVAVATSCKDTDLYDDINDPRIHGNKAKEEGNPFMKIYVYTPELAGTRATTGDVEADLQYENTIHTLDVWVYLKNSNTPFKYKQETDVDLTTSSHEIIFTMTDAEKTQLSGVGYLVDVYVVVNKASVGLGSLGSSTSKSSLATAKIGTSYFGISGNSAQVSAPTSDGLPMSAMLSEVEAKEESFNMFVVRTLYVKRAVSKVRLVFARSEDMREARITGVSLDANCIPTEEDLFNPYVNDDPSNPDYAVGDYTAASIGNTYYSSNVNFGSLTNAQIPLHPAPIQLSWEDGMDAQEYEDIVNAALTAGTATQLARAYLHESDKKLSVTISYRLYDTDTADRTATIEMDAAGDFIRNHTWTVYAYFLTGKLYLNTTLLPWNAAHDWYSYSTLGSVRMSWNNYLRYDIDKLSYTWNDTYTAVAWNNANPVAYSPQIELTTISPYTLRLQVNNEQFRFVINTGTTEDPVLDYSYGQSYDITGVGNIITRFFLIPVSGVQPTDRVAKVMLIEVHTGDGMNPVNIPFNHDLPGDEDHTTILYYNVNSANYSTNMNNPKDRSQGLQASQYWIEKKVWD